MQKLADVANVQRQLSALGEAGMPFDQGTASRAIEEILKELRLIRQVEIQNGKFLKAIWEAVN
jgi:hypothetical protein